MVTSKNPLALSIAFGMAVIFAAIAPYLFSSSKEKGSLPRRPPWPTYYEEKPLIALGLSKREALFVKGFPGQIERFSDGNREIIIRWVDVPTRRLHPATDCFQGAGYSITPLPLKTNHHGVKMGCFTATRQSSRLEVCEYIQDSEGNSWSDVSAWYWSALLSPVGNGWWSYVIAESKKVEGTN